MPAVQVGWDLNVLSRPMALIMVAIFQDYEVVVLLPLVEQDPFLSWRELLGLGRFAETLAEFQVLENQ